MPVSLRMVFLEIWHTYLDKALPFEIDTKEENLVHSMSEIDRFCKRL